MFDVLTYLIKKGIKSIKHAPTKVKEHVVDCYKITAIFINIGIYKGLPHLPNENQVNYRLDFNK